MIIISIYDSFSIQRVFNEKRAPHFNYNSLMKTYPDRNGNILKSVFLYPENFHQHFLFE